MILLHHSKFSAFGMAHETRALSMEQGYELTKVVLRLKKLSQLHVTLLNVSFTRHPVELGIVMFLLVLKRASHCKVRCVLSAHEGLCDYGMISGTIRATLSTFREFHPPNNAFWKCTFLMVNHTWFSVSKFGDPSAPMGYSIILP